MLETLLLSREVPFLALGVMTVAAVTLLVLMW